MLHGSGSSAGRVPLLDQGPQGNWGPRLYHQLRGGCWFRNCVNISVSLATSIYSGFSYREYTERILCR